MVSAPELLGDTLQLRQTLAGQAKCSVQCRCPIFTYEIVAESVMNVVHTFQLRHAIQHLRHGMGNCRPTVVNRVTVEAWIFIVELPPCVVHLHCHCVVLTIATPGPHHCAALEAQGSKGKTENLQGNYGKRKTLRCLLSLHVALVCAMKYGGGPTQPTNHHHPRPCDNTVTFSESNCTRFLVRCFAYCQAPAASTCAETHEVN